MSKSNDNAECEVLRLASNFYQAMNDFDEAAEMARGEGKSDSKADGISFPIAAKSVSLHALDRAEHYLDAMSFASCSSMEGALLLLTSAGRELGRAIEQMVPRHTDDGELRTDAGDLKQFQRRAHRLQAEAMRFIAQSGNNTLTPELLGWVGEFSERGLSLHTPDGIVAVRTAAGEAANEEVAA